ncbi:MAG: hypothetical protein ACOYN6_00920 [Ignavibacteria bacterium]
MKKVILLVGIMSLCLCIACSEGPNRETIKTDLAKYLNERLGEYFSYGSKIDTLDFDIAKSERFEHYDTIEVNKNQYNKQKGTEIIEGSEYARGADTIIKYTKKGKPVYVYECVGRITCGKESIGFTVKLYYFEIISPYLFATSEFKWIYNNDK